MDAFEEIVGQLLEEEGFWVRHSVKINLTKDEKVKIGKPTVPRPEIDLVIYSIPHKKVYLLEVKSFLDSPGVKVDAVTDDNEVRDGSYKLLTSQIYRETLVARLKEDWGQNGVIEKDVQFSFGLVAGKVHQNKENELRDYFDKKGWFFWGPSIIKDKIIKLANKGYENNVMIITSKMINRK